METAVWLAIVSGLLTVIGTLAAMAYRDIIRRLAGLEKQDAKLFTAVFTLLIAKTSDPQAVAEAMHTLITNGIKIV